jgi:hypothetical protein
LLARWTPSKFAPLIDHKLHSILCVLCAFAVYFTASAAEEKSHRVTELQVPGEGKPGFTLLDPKITGISFTNVLAQQRHLTNQILLNGSGGRCRWRRLV